MSHQRKVIFVTATELRRQFESFLEAAKYSDIVITRHNEYVAKLSVIEDDELTDLLNRKIEPTTE